MAIEDGFFTHCKVMLDEAIKSFMKTTSDGLITGLEPLLITALTIYFMCKAWSIMYGNGEGSMKQLTMQVIKMAFVTSMFCSTAYFYNNIAEPVYKLDEPFVDMVSKPFPFKPKDSFDALDKIYLNMIDKAASISAKVVEKAFTPTKVSVGLGSVDIPNIPAAFYGLVLILCIAIMILCTVFAVFVAFLILITNTIGLCFVLAFGPLFGAFLLFPQTKDLFQTWLRSCLNFVLTKVFVTAAITLMGQMIMNSFNLNDATSSSSMPGIAAVFAKNKDYGTYVLSGFSGIVDLGIKFIFMGALVLLFGIFVMKCPAISTAIVGAGASAMGGGGAAQAANQLAGAAGGLVTGGAGGMVGKAIGKAAGKAAESQEAKGHKWRAGALRWMNREFTPKPKESSGPSKS